MTQQLDSTSSLYPIGMIPYANMGPFRALGAPAGCRFIEYTPRQSTVALLQGKLLAAPAPVGDLPSLQSQVTPLGSFGIAAGGPVQSVLLLYLLLGRQLGFTRLPTAVTNNRDADGELLIGDDALRIFNGRRRGRIVTDLAEAWREATGLPFVFARWVVRRDAPQELQHRLLAWLDTFAEREEELVLSSVEPEAARVGISEEAMLDYLRHMTRVLGDEELAGQALFLRELSDRAPHLLAPTSYCFPPAPTTTGHQQLSTVAP